MRSSDVARGALAAVIAALLALPAVASAERDYTVRYTSNSQGDITGTGNTLMTCLTTDSKCGAAQQGQASGADNNNNNRAMTWVDIDGDSNTFNSSAATLGLPPGARVLFAGLYYGGDLNTGSGGQPPPNPGARDKVLFRPPNLGTYIPLTASVIDDSIGTPPRLYQGFVDVTDYVKAAGPGEYTVANVQLGTGLNADQAGGWALAVAYEDTNQPTRNLTIFDGFHFVLADGPPVTIPLNGFTTPKTGPVTTTLGLVALEGDLGTPGDSATLNGKVLSNATNPASNFFNASISGRVAGQNGVTFTAKRPNHLNQLGFDADIFDATGLLTNNQRSTTLVLATSGDGYVPNGISFATDLFAPSLKVTKAVDKTEAVSGNELTYTLSVTNSGLDAADNTILHDAIPANSTYEPGSLRIDSGANAGAKTDGSGDDQAEFDAAGNAVVFRLGAGAGATTDSGGKLAVNESTTISFKVKVNEDAKSRSRVVNNASVGFISDTLQTPGQVTSPDVVTTIKVPDLTINKSHTGDFVSGRTVPFTLRVSNVGDAPSRGKVTVTDNLDPALHFVGQPSGDGWDCSATTARKLTCTRDDPLAPNDAYPDIHYTARIDRDAPEGTLRNTGVVSGGGDGNELNNTDTNKGDNAKPSIDLAIDKVALTPFALPGGPVVFRLLVTNLGDDTATHVIVRDVLPPGLTAVRAITSKGFCRGTSCHLGSVKPGAVVTITLVALAGRDTGGKTLTDNADVHGRETDPVPENNEDSADVRIISIADLAVTKTTAEPSLPAGSDVSFTVVVRNNGPSTATNVTVDDLIPAGLIPVSATPTQGTCSTPNSCNLGTLADRAAAQIVIVARSTPALAGTSVRNTVTVKGHEPDLNLANNKANADVAFTALPPVPSDVVVTKTVDQQAVNVGDQLTYRITATNRGPGPASSVLVTDTPDPKLSILSVQPSQGTCTLGPAITCQVGPLAPGASATVVVRAQVTAPGALPNAVTAIAPSPLPGTDPADQVDVAAARAAATAPEVTLTKRASRSTVSPGQTVTFTMTARATGDGTAHNVEICDRVPSQFTVVSADKAVRRNGRSCFRTADLDGGKTFTATIVARAGSVGVPVKVTNVATVTVGGQNSRSARAGVTIRAPEPAFTG
jgi:uncharacterized repeat protein (TIGR01451 family)